MPAATEVIKASLRAERSENRREVESIKSNRRPVMNNLHHSASASRRYGAKDRWRDITAGWPRDECFDRHCETDSIGGA